MIDKKIKVFFKLFRKQKKVFDKLLPDKSCDAEVRQEIILCLTEIYFGSKHAIELTKKISETNTNFTKGDLDSLLGNLIDLRIEIYDKMVDWIRDLKKPLKNVIDKVAGLVDQKKDAAIARKTIHSSKKQIDNNLKKIKYYTAYNNPNKKSRHAGLAVRGSLKSR
jgi:hypothetical protein